MQIVRHPAGSPEDLTDVKNSEVDTRRRANKLMGVNQPFWYVAHTRPRCEKKLLLYCEREDLDARLLCHRSVHKYRGKTAVFKKPLFPG